MTAFPQRFAFLQPGRRVNSGPGARHGVAAEIERLGCCRAVVLSTPGRAEMAQAVAADLGGLAVGTLARARMHTPVEAQALRADCLVAVGGGSAIGLSKALALRTKWPQIVIPTTYAGSEATPVLGQTEAGRKTTINDPRVQPEVIIYDAELVLSLPVPITVASALNAMAHAAEGLYAENRNPVSTQMAVEGLRAFHRALPMIRDDPTDLEVRGETLYGAWLCGTVLGQVGMALHHKLCHVLGGGFGLPHAETHAVLLPHTVGFNARAVPDLLRPVTEIFGAPDAGRALYDFARAVEGPRALRDFGMRAEDLEAAADLAMQSPYWNPRPLERDAILRLLMRAWGGEPPDA